MQRGRVRLDHHQLSIVSLPLLAGRMARFGDGRDSHDWLLG